MLGNPDISVVLPTYNRPKLLVECLRSLESQSLTRRRYEVVVVNDGSGPSTSALLHRLKESDPRLVVIDLPRNSGPATARNRGVAEAKAPIVLFLDDDMVAPPELVETHLEFHDPCDDRLGIVGLVTWHPTLQKSAFMSWLETTDIQFGFEFAGGMQPGLVARPWERFYTCNLSLRRQLFLDVGGFDERFPYAAFEDTELALRLVEQGFSLHYRPEALAWHARPLSLFDFCRRMERVGESAVILNQIHAEYPPNLPAGEKPSLKRQARLAITAGTSKVLRTRSSRERYYQLAIDIAYQRGVATGRRRLQHSR